MKEPIPFSGVITVVTRDGRSAVVKLDKAAEGYRTAVISPDTRGRVILMNGTGHLEVGTKVSGVGRKGPEALRAFDVHSIR